ncbi:hypothetical protein NDA18_004555 [Ustilago nuda]|nr:hypothetical protein NDA18_004555 [Ustilago nuda]
MSFINKVFEAGSWDVSLPTSPTPPCDTEQEQGAPPALSPVTSPINQMSATPSTQSIRAANNGAKKNFVWQAQDIKHLVDTIYINESYQHTILPSRRNEANKPANKLRKDTVALSAKYPWFEKMHKMMNRRVLVGPAILLTTPSLDATGNEDSNHVLPGSDPMEEFSDADLDHTVHAQNLPPIHDLVDAAPSNAGDCTDFDISTPPPLHIQSDALVSSLSTFSNRASSSQANDYKCKHNNVEQKQDSLEEAFYRSSIESLSIHLKLVQELTKQEAECTKQEELWLQHKCKERE